ncbi:hypothetical protein CCR75_003007 [Bremia lactucae]|uniref:Major facilitator superfamily (MFS) profile domain-containing protein n=1 Tax=Bremia lactucae TaxID=4779 RepID=A0A976FEW8_BRELC|nr:hypothetical protein CCR75_003007 [Bremia lactucae]
MEPIAPLSDTDVVRTKAERRERYMQKTRAEAGYLFKYLILTQIIVYLEAGSIPCLLDQLSVSLNLNASQQGALGGVVYLALSAASPLCAFFLHRFPPRIVLGLSLVCNNVAVLMLALTPTGFAYSGTMLILARAAVGFTQAFPCIYTPLWVDEYAPRAKVAGWMSYLQGSVPMGVMLGYFAGTVTNWVVPETFSLIQTWRWPFLLQFLALLPLNVAIFFVPPKHLLIRRDTEVTHVTGSGSTSSSDDSLTTAAPILQDYQLKQDDRGSADHEPCGSSRGGVRSAPSRHGFGLHSFFDEAIASTPMSTRSTPYHDEEDALLASASMYGASSQRSVRQLHHNHYRLSEDDTPSSLRRSVIGRPPSSMRLFDTAFSDHDERNAKTENESDAKTVSSTYGALDTAITLASPCVSLSMLEDELTQGYEQGAFADGMYELLHLPIFCLIVFGLTTVYFVVTGVQYWSTIFMIKSLHASKYLVNGLFVIVSGTGPILGVFYGGWLIDRYGGYLGVEQRAKALGICMILGLIAFFISAVTTFFEDIYITAGCLWLLLFFGGAVLPACTGIFLSVVPAEHRALASSFSVMIFNLCGYALSPYLTGLIMEWVISQQAKANTYFKHCDEACAYRLGFRFCLCWSIWSVLCIGAAWRLASRQAEKARQVQHFYASHASEEAHFLEKSQEQI